jgi:class 3 adenylate cyclase
VSALRARQAGRCDTPLNARCNGHPLGAATLLAGDGMFATFDGPACAVACALALARQARAIGIEIRAGVHTGEIEASGEKVAGVAVHFGARVMAQAGAGEVLVSATAKDLTVGTGLAFEQRGAYALKGVPEEWLLYRAADH